MDNRRLETLLTFYKEDPQDAFTRFALASEYLRHGDVAKALTFFEQLVVDEPGYVGTYYHLGKLYELENRTDDAISIYQKGIHIAQEKRDFHARAELQGALLEAQGFGFEDETFD